MIMTEKIEGVEYCHQKVLIEDLNEYNITKINNNFVYDDVIGAENNYAIVRRGQGIGMIDIYGEEIVPCIYGAVWYFTDGFAVVQAATNNLFGYVNNAGKEIIEPQFQMAYHFNEKMAAVQSTDNHFWGYINEIGELIIPYKYSAVSSFYEGLAAVKFAATGLWGFINKQGKEIIACENEYVSDFENGKAIVKNGSTCYSIGNDGSIIETVDMTNPDDFYNQIKDAQNYFPSDLKKDKAFFNKFLANLKEVPSTINVYRRNDLYGYVNNYNEKITSIDYDDAKPFIDGIGALKKNNKWGLVNTSGEFITSGIYLYEPLIKQTINYRYMQKSDGLDQPIALNEIYGLKITVDNVITYNWYTTKKERDEYYESNTRGEAKELPNTRLMN